MSLFNKKISQMDEAIQLLENAYIPIIQGTPEQNYIIKADKLGGGLASVIADNDTITGNGTALDPLKATISIIDSELAPENPTQGQRWVDPTSGIKYEYIDGIWVEFSAAGTSDGGGGSTIELSTSLEETVQGKALDATMGKSLNVAKMNRLQNGNGNINVVTLQALVGLGFDLTGANLTGANLTGASLHGANLENANLENANLTGAYLDLANLSGANLTGANLINAYSLYVNLYNAQLYYANLTGANLSYANLYNAQLYYANLTGAHLSYANLPGANLTGATGLGSDINIALGVVNKNPRGNGSIWTIIWTDGITYQCDPSTGIFTQQ